MVVIWAGRKEDAEDFKRKSVLGRGGVIVAGNHSSRTLDGLRPTAVIQLDGAGEGDEGKKVREILSRSITKSGKPCPWIDLRGMLS